MLLSFLFEAHGLRHYCFFFQLSHKQFLKRRTMPYLCIKLCLCFLKLWKLEKTWSHLLFWFEFQWLRNLSCQKLWFSRNAMKSKTSICGCIQEPQGYYRDYLRGGIHKFLKLLTVSDLLCMSIKKTCMFQVPWLIFGSTQQFCQLISLHRFWAEESKMKFARSGQETTYCHTQPLRAWLAVLFD